MTTLDERNERDNVRERLAVLEATAFLRVEVATIKAIVEGGREALKVALESKGELDKERNNIVEALRSVITECVRKSDYDKRHDEVFSLANKNYKDLLDRITVERDFRNRLLGVGLLVGILWPIIVAAFTAWLRR